MAQETKKKTIIKKKVSTVKKAPVKKSKDLFAVIEISGIQLKVKEGERYEINKIEGKKGDKVEVKEILMTSDGESIKVGKPYIDGAKVTLAIDAQLKGNKVEGFKYKAKARYRRKYGYRAELTRVIVKKIE